MCSYAQRGTRRRINLNPRWTYITPVPGAAADFREGRMVVYSTLGKGRVSKGGVEAMRMPPRRRWRRRDEGRNCGNAAWEPRGREGSPPFVGRGTAGGRWILQPGEIVDDENRRSRLVVSRSLTRVGLFFILDTRRVQREFRVWKRR